jgi:hypothetical protein
MKTSAEGKRVAAVAENLIDPFIPRMPYLGYPFASWAPRNGMLSLMQEYMVGQLISIALATQKRRASHLRLVVKRSLAPNLDAARGIINGLMMSSLFWLIALMLLNA